MSLGKRIQLFRKQKGLSQEQLADQLNVSRQALSKWESDINVPNVEKIMEVAKALEVTVNELLGIEESADNEYAKLESILNQVVLTQNNEIKRNRKYMQTILVTGVIVIVAGCIILWGVFNNISRLNQGIRSSNIDLNNKISVINDQISSLSGSLAAQIKEQLQSQDSLLSSFDYKIESIDFDNRTMKMNFDLVAKKYDNNSKVYLALEYENNERQNYQLTLENGHFKMTENLPVDNILNATVTIEGTEKHSQLIKDVATYILDGLKLNSYGCAKNFNLDDIKCSIRFNKEDGYIFDDYERKMLKFYNQNKLVSADVNYKHNNQEQKLKVTLKDQEIIFKIPRDNIKDGDKLYLVVTYEDKLGITDTLTYEYNVFEAYGYGLWLSEVEREEY